MPTERCPEAVFSAPSNLERVLEANAGRTLEPGRITLADLERRGFLC